MGNRTDHSATIGTGNRILVFDGDSISYDADGNVTEKKKPGSFDRKYFWSAESLLDSASLDGSSFVKYEYNAFGKPVKKSRRTSGAGWAVDSYFLWDGEQLLAELDSAGHRKSDYIYYPGTDQPYAVTLGATTPTSVKLIEQDALGNVIGTIDGTSVSEKVSYDSWGVPTVTGNSDSRLLWKGLLWEGDAVSLYYMRNRWYDPELGRFMSEDPIGHEGGDNLYAFSGDDPVDGSDPTGLGGRCADVDKVMRWIGGEWVQVCRTDPMPLDPISVATRWQQPDKYEQLGIDRSFGPLGAPMSSLLYVPAPNAPITRACTHVSREEIQLAIAADNLSAITGTEEGYFTISQGWADPITIPIDDSFRKTASSIIGAPAGLLRSIHNHPSGRGISENDSVYAYQTGARVVSGSGKTRMFGAINVGGHRVSAVCP